jgi:hypothetical protein
VPHPNNNRSHPALIVATEVVCWLLVQIVLALGLIVCAATYFGLVIAPTLLFGVNYFAARERAGHRATLFKHKVPFLWAGLFNVIAVGSVLTQIQGHPAPLADWEFMVVWVAIPSGITIAVLVFAGVTDGAVAAVLAAVAAAVAHILVPDTMGVLEMVIWNFVVSLGLWCWTIRTKLQSNPSRRGCVRCGYSLVGLPTSQCPECGHHNGMPATMP